MQKKNIKIMELLTEFGLETDEAKVYQALLDKGMLLPQHLAHETGINRATLYTMFPSLIETGVIKEIKQGKRRFLAPISPEDLFERYQEKYKNIKENIAELTAMYRLQGMKPKIEVYEGVEQIKKLYLDTLHEKQEILVYNRISRYREDFLAWMSEVYVSRRVNKGIKVRALVTEDKLGGIMMASGKEYLRETVFIPEKYAFKIETMIYGDKICFVTCEKGGPVVGIMVQNREIVDSQRAMFELAWDGLKNLRK